MTEPASLLDPFDLHGLTDAVERIYQNDSLHAELSGKSLRQASNFSWAKHMDTVVGCYGAALPQNRQRPPTPVPHDA